MKKIDFGQTITILANVGVIAGIMFLGVELQQNNQLMRAEAISTLFDSRMTVNEQWAENRNIAEIRLKNFNGEALTELEDFQLRAQLARGFLGWQRDYFYFQVGILPEEDLRANFPLMKRVFTDSGKTLGEREFWDRYFKRDASPAFIRYIEKCIILECDDIPR